MTVPPARANHRREVGQRRSCQQVALGQLDREDLPEREDLTLPASYANFYIANEVVLVPTFNDPNDTPAIATIQWAFPDRRVMPIDCRELIWGLGAFHCLSQQEPK